MAEMAAHLLGFAIPCARIGIDPDKAIAGPPLVTLKLSEGIANPSLIGGPFGMAGLPVARIAHRLAEIGGAEGNRVGHGHLLR
jgi:hypothetical protein